MRRAGDGVGMYDAVRRRPSYASSAGPRTASPTISSSINTKFRPGCVAPNALVVFPPEDHDGIGLFDAETGTFTFLDICATVSA